MRKALERKAIKNVRGKESERATALGGGQRRRDDLRRSHGMVAHKYHIVNINYKYYVVKELGRRSNGNGVS